MMVLHGTFSKFSALGMEFLFFINNANDVIQSQILEGRLFEQDLLKLIGEKDIKGVCLDIGANIGNHSIYFSKSGKFNKVIPIEPNPAAIELLNINLQMNNLDNIDNSYIGIGLGNRSGNYSAETPEKNLGATKLKLSEFGEILVKKGDDLFSSFKDIGFIKIDVEGMEIEVLKGLKDTIQSNKPIIWIEVSVRYKGALEKWLPEAGYKIDEVLVQRKFKSDYLLVPL